MKLLQSLIWILIFACVGCASKKGFNRGDLKEQIGVVNPVTDDTDIAKTLKKKANLPKPFKLAVYFKNPIQNGAVNSTWRWSEEDKESLIKEAEKLKEEKIVSQVFPIISSLVQEEDVKSIRMAAAKHGADAVLIISGVADVDRYINNWGWTYILLAPALFIPGSEADTLFMANASMWDVRNEFLYITAESEEIYEKTYVAAFGENDKFLIGEAKKKALEKLASQLGKMIKGQ
ncbi:MAG: hypothetical protein H6626_02865 [Pseudobdellovibrionaceae bacterium]|nr:MAG: hypothetical protein H6626_02865 [Pseudobdellovibrionaceae bacterium]